MNEVIKAMKDRRSCRKFNSTPVPDAIIDEIVEAGLYAANGRGAQCPVIAVVKDEQTRKAISILNRRIGGWEEGFDPFYGATCYLWVLAPKDNPTYIYDGSLVMGNLMLAAHALGVSSIWIHRAKEESECEEGRAILDEIGIPEGYVGIGHCAIGYSDAEPNAAAPRKENRVFKK